MADMQEFPALFIFMQREVFQRRALWDASDEKLVLFYLDDIDVMTNREERRLVRETLPDFPTYRLLWDASELRRALDNNNNTLDESSFDSAAILETLAEFGESFLQADRAETRTGRWSRRMAWSFPMMNRVYTGNVGDSLGWDGKYGAIVRRMATTDFATPESKLFARWMSKGDGAAVLRDVAQAALALSFDTWLRLQTGHGLDRALGIDKSVRSSFFFVPSPCSPPLYFPAEENEHMPAPSLYKDYMRDLEAFLVVVAKPSQSAEDHEELRKTVLNRVARALHGVSDGAPISPARASVSPTLDVN